MKTKIFSSMLLKAKKKEGEECSGHAQLPLTGDLQLMKTWRKHEYEYWRENIPASTLSVAVFATRGFLSPKVSRGPRVRSCFDLCIYTAFTITRVITPFFTKKEQTVFPTSHK